MKRGLSFKQQQSQKQEWKTWGEGRGMWCDAFSYSCIHSVFFREAREGKKGRKATLFHSELISGFQMLCFCSQLTPPPPTTEVWGSLKSKGAQTHERTHKIALSTPNTFLLAIAHSHTCTPVSAHITGRPSINKHKSNEKQHNTLQLGHFKHVQEELLTPIQQPSRDRANSCLPYPTELRCRQERHGSVLSSLRVWGLEVQPSTTRPTALSSRCGGREQRMPSRGEKGRGECSEAEMKGCYMASVLAESGVQSLSPLSWRGLVHFSVTSSFHPPSHHSSSYFILSFSTSLPHSILLFLHLFTSLCHLFHPTAYLLPAHDIPD